jgi:hypothetical protein
MRIKISSTKIIKSLVIIVTMAGPIACNQQGTQVKILQARIDSLQKELTEIYKPGFGEFMSSIQVHHAKLWFAGINENWELAGFEIHEIEEALEDLQKFCTDRPEAKEIKIMNLPMDSVSAAIQNKNLGSFKKSYTLLTNTCNNCHKVTQHEFNIVTIPAAVPVSNQSFKPAH